MGSAPKYEELSSTFIFINNTKCYLNSEHKLNLRTTFNSNSLLLLDDTDCVIPTDEKGETIFKLDENEKFKHCKLKWITDIIEFPFKEHFSKLDAQLQTLDIAVNQLQQKQNQLEQKVLNIATSTASPQNTNGTSTSPQNKLLKRASSAKALLTELILNEQTETNNSTDTNSDSDDDPIIDNNTTNSNTANTVKGALPPQQQQQQQQQSNIKNLLRTISTPMMPKSKDKENQRESTPNSATNATSTSASTTTTGVVSPTITTAENTGNDSSTQPVLKTGYLEKKRGKQKELDQTLFCAHG